MVLYAKVGANDRQSTYVGITPDTYASTINSMWNSLLARANGDTTFQLYVYVEKSETRAQQIRRATENRIREVAARLAARIMDVPRAPEDVPGPAQLRYHATHLARQMDDPFVERGTVESSGRVFPGKEAAGVPRRDHA
ncbi:hypothetical protein SDRG_02243 [Saprolegnia diclina VS20]|uniref:Uncharacterized protein n=1 Tax=Saprolegnia diclina (strain VS20) TaxID=1156394 RepID=T0PPD7_SAPDV|nr:hypothetical protein SDRG_02243 [Saprolegnia diclina VS20]XP_008619312.1 hypothetical protein SDRG_14930 [Saprolegnia diclina VS20]EQC27309.1 hypothetical protein SDRG_14930 [Saprolegnia diclina VS20]EQC40342.1 hypothetical protein SDRG_02243 [Saprolegnia diclina VS20]|eukprot:XP_008606041.1 hypothetical protein SDRG_02243 [Saprolegnia diclina VS20]